MKSMSQKKAILLLHGLGGSPVEMSYIKLFLEHHGFHVEVPLLPGHGTHYRDLLDVEWHDYVVAANETFVRLKSEYASVSISGICMGALLALQLGVEHGTAVNAIVPISTTLFYDGWSLPYLARYPALLRWTPLFYFYDVKEDHPYGIKNENIRKWIAHAMTENSSTHYSRVPFQSVWQMHLLSQHLRKGLNKIKSPVLAIHPTEDEVSSLKSVKFMSENIETSLFRYLLLENSYHLATLDQERGLVASTLAQFCDSVTLANEKKTA